MKKNEMSDGLYQSLSAISIESLVSVSGLLCVSDGLILSLRSLWGREHGAYSELGELSGWLGQGLVLIGVMKEFEKELSTSEISSAHVSCGGLYL